MADCALWGFEWGEVEWGASTPWGARANGNPGDTDSPLVTIPPGCLDAVQTTTDRIFKQWLETVTWPDLMSAIGEPFAELDAVASHVGAKRYRATSQGLQLEEVGAAVNRPRGALADDTDYRIAVLVDAVSLFSSGTIPELIDLGNRLTGNPAEVTEFFPATVRLRIRDMDPGLFDLLADLLSNVPAGGVTTLLSTYDSIRTGGWSSTRSPLESAGDSVIFDPNMLTLVDRVTGIVGVASGTTYDPVLDARDFTPTDDRLTFASIADLTASAVSGSAWLRHDGYVAGEAVWVAEDTGGGNGMRLILTSGGQRLWFEHDYDTTDVYRYTTALVLDDGPFHHVAWTYDGLGLFAGIRIYLDGVEQAYTGGVDGVGTPDTLDGDWLIGDGPGLPSFDGEISDFQIFDRVLDEHEIRHLYREGPVEQDDPIADPAVWSSVYGTTANSRAHWATARQIGA